MSDKSKAAELADVPSKQGLEALSMAAQGQSYDYIAGKLELWPWDLRKLFKQTRKALGALNDDEAIQKAKEQGLI